MRVFLNDLSSDLGLILLKKFQQCGHEVVGCVSEVAAIAPTRRKIQSHASSDTPQAPSDPVVFRSNETGIRALLKESDLIVHSIYENPADALITLRLLDSFQDDPDQQDVESKHYTFVGLSTVLTWAKNSFPEADFNGFKEDDYKSRKPSRKYAEYKAVETQIIGYTRPGRISTFVIASGLLYGAASNPFELIFEQAWTLRHDAVAVPSVGDCGGANFLPTISIHDLASIAMYLGVEVANKSECPDKQYILALDNSRNTLCEITQAVSDVLSTGRIRELSETERDDMMLNYPSIAALQVNLQFDMDESTVTLSEIELNFRDGLIKNIDTVVEDYIQARDLRPLRICVLGPPCVGKSSQCAKLAKKYFLPLLSPKTLLEHIKNHENPDGDVLLQMTQEEYLKLRDEAAGYWDTPSVLSFPLLKRLFDVKAKSPACRNHGYVLDGFPDTFLSAKELFEILETEPASGDAENEGEAKEKGGDAETEDDLEPDRQEIRRKERLTRLSKVPDATHVIILDADDNVLKNRALAFTEEQAKESRNTEDEFQARLNLFREANGVDNSENIASFFEKYMNIDVLEVIDSGSNTTEIRKSIQGYIESGGKPFNFHPTKEEAMEILKEEETRKAGEAAKEQENQQQLLNLEATENEARLKKEGERMGVIQKEEEDLLEARSKPLRAYLMETVIPALTEGMLEVVKMQPEDPIDFLSEFLFRKGNELEQQASSTN